VTYKELTDQQKQELITYFDSDNGTIPKTEFMTVLCNKYGIKLRTAYNWRANIISEMSPEEFEETQNTKHNIVSQESKTIYKQSEEIKSLRRALEEAREEVHLADNLHDLINNINGRNIDLSKLPQWISKTKDTNDNIVPVICLSDLHIGSVVNPADINYVNEYNVTIARDRIFSLVDDFIDIYVNKFSKYKYDGVVCILGGDIIENAMHGKEETNELTVIDQVIKSSEILIMVVEKLKKAFGKVFVPSVSGNHGRLIADKYVKNEDRYNHSLEKIIYYNVAKHFDRDSSVTVYNQPSDILYFSINGLRFRLEHGDAIQFTGQAISGPLNSWERARLKRASVDSSMNKPFDIFICGHWHCHVIQEKMVVMDSPVGYNAYSQRLSMPYSLPGITTFAINSNGNLIFSTNLKSRKKVERPQSNNRIEIF